MERIRLQHWRRSSCHDEFQYDQDCEEAEGIVAFAEMSLSDARGRLQLKLRDSDTIFEVESCDRQGSVPQVYVGDHVVLHIEYRRHVVQKNNFPVVGIQVLRDGEVVLRVVLNRDTGYYHTDTVTSRYRF